MTFNVLISNTDDHLRNHGFFWTEAGWALSPAFDLNPVPVDVKPRAHALALDESSVEASMDTVREVTDRFGLDYGQARRVAGEVAAATGRWREVARSHGLKPADLDRMASAFEHRDLEVAAGFGG